MRLLLVKDLISISVSTAVRDLNIFQLRFKWNTLPLSNHTIARIQMDKIIRLADKGSIEKFVSCIVRPILLFINRFNLKNNVIKTIGIMSLRELNPEIATISKIRVVNILRYLWI